jgi:GT2 family glycosyltransferase
MIDIVIVNYKSTDYLVRCLRSIYADPAGVPVQVYVQDNESLDDIGRALAEFPGVALTRNRDNLGFGKAVNQALRVSRGEYVVLLNPDTVVRPGFFKTSLEFMNANPRVAVMGPRICEENGRLQNSARAFPTPLTALFGRSSLMSRWFPKNPVTTRNLLSLQSDGVSPMNVDWISGACMIVRRSAIEQAGMLDERFFMYWEDADWCRRMWLAGWEVVYFPRPCVIHSVGVSSEKLVVRAAYEFHRSSFNLFKKYARPTHWFVWMLISIGLYLRFCIVIASGTLIRLFERFQGTQKKQPPLARQRLGPRRVRVLRLIARLNIGGPAIHAHLLANGLDKNRFESFLVTGRISPQEGDMSYLFDDGDVKPINVPALQREINIRYDLQSFFQIFKIVRRIEPDIVHTHTAKAGTSARLAVMVYELISGRSVLKVHTFHGHAFKGYFSRPKSLLFIWIERLLAIITDVIVAISRSQKVELTEHYRIAPKEKVRTIQLGFDLDPFLSCRALKGQFRRRLGVDRTTPLIGIIGRLVPIKNHQMFLMAARMFVDLYPWSPALFVIVGGRGAAAGAGGPGAEPGAGQPPRFLWMGKGSPHGLRRPGHPVSDIAQRGNPGVDHRSHGRFGSGGFHQCRRCPRPPRPSDGNPGHRPLRRLRKGAVLPDKRAGTVGQRVGAPPKGVQR